MSTSDAHQKSLYWAGVALGPAAWGIDQQGLYTMTHFACTKEGVASVIGPAVLAAISLTGSFISARAVKRRAASEWVEAQGGRARNFMAWLGVGTGVLFALVIANQLAASLIIGPCLR
jgi:hypothetical protein